MYTRSLNEINEPGATASMRSRFDWNRLEFGLLSTCSGVVITEIMFLSLSDPTMDGNVFLLRATAY